MLALSDRELESMSFRAMTRVACIFLLGAGLLGGCKFFHKTYTAQGVYFGSFTPSGSTSSVPVYGAILAGQYAYAGATNGNLYVLPDTIRNNSFTDSVTGFPPLGQAFGNGQTIRNFTFDGQGSDNSSIVDNINGTLSGDTGGGKLDLSYENLSANAPSLSALAGTYQGYYWGNSTSVTVTISNTGAISFNDSFGCSGLGNLSIVQNYDLLQVNATISGNSVCPGSVSGIGFTDTKDLNNLFQNQSGTYLYMGMSNSITGFVVELYKS